MCGSNVTCTTKVLSETHHCTCLYCTVKIFLWMKIFYAFLVSCCLISVSCCCLKPILRLFRRYPKRKLLTKEEYEHQAVVETDKALKQLRQYCRRNSSIYDTVDSLQNQKGFVLKFLLIVGFIIDNTVHSGYATSPYTPIWSVAVCATDVMRTCPRIINGCSPYSAQKQLKTLQEMCRQRRKQLQPLVFLVIEPFRSLLTLEATYLCEKSLFTSSIARLV